MKAYNGGGMVSINGATGGELTGWRVGNPNRISVRGSVRDGDKTINGRPYAEEAPFLVAGGTRNW